MSELRSALREYLKVRRALGFSLVWPGRELPRFVEFVERAGASSITIDLALRWAQQFERHGPQMWAARLSMARGFARYRAASDPRTQVPPDRLLPFRCRRKTPYLYSDEDVERLVAAARRLRTRRGLRALTFSTLFGLHAVTGLRTSESLRLDRDDVDLRRGLLCVRQTKFGKTRLVPLHATSVRALARYAQARDRTIRAPATPALFVTEKGQRIDKSIAYIAFRRAALDAGIRPRADGRRPRIHDLRHRFAIKTMTDWYRSGADVERLMPRLSTFLGHTHTEGTFWYLSATPELLRLAARRLDTGPAGRRSR